MKVFLDANILVAVLNKEFPTFTYAARILSLADKPPYQLYTSPICIAIAYYFAEKKCGSSAAKQKMAILTTKIKIAEVSNINVKEAIEDKRVLDLEDGLEYYAARSAGCQYLVTEDTDDFHFAGIPVLNSHDFFVSVF